MVFTRGISRKFKRNRTLIPLSLFLCIIIILNTELSPDLYFLHWDPLENTSCFYTNTGGALPSAEESSFSPQNNSIFFHETSCRGGLNSRQACAVESAARAHPHWQIHVLFSAPVNKFSVNEGSLLALQGFQNINFARVHVVEYAKGTPLESLVSGGALNRTRWRISHTSDVLRYLTLYKWGGVYLDLDVVVARPFTSLASNWAARENPWSVASGAMSFSRDGVGRFFAEVSIRDLASRFRGDVWGHNGPGVITRVLKDLCSTSVVAAMSASTCKGFEVYDPQSFYPVDGDSYQKYFDSAELNVSNPYTYHIFSSNSFKINVTKYSNYAKIAKKILSHDICKFWRLFWCLIIKENTFNYSVFI